MPGHQACRMLLQRVEVNTKWAAIDFRKAENKAIGRTFWIQVPFITFEIQEKLRIAPPPPKKNKIKQLSCFGVLMC